MKLAHPLLDGCILFKENVNFLIIENNGQFYKLCTEFYNLSQGNLGEFCLSINDKIIEFEKNSLVIHDFFGLDFSSKKIKTVVDGAVQEELKKADYILDVAKINTQIALLNEKVLSQIDLPIDFAQEFSLEKFIKLSEYFICQQQTFLDKLVTYIDVFIKIKKIKLVVFIGLVPFLTQQELNDLIVQLKYMQINVLFVEHSTENVGNYPKIIIDKDLCQI